MFYQTLKGQVINLNLLTHLQFNLLVGELNLIGIPEILFLKNPKISLRSARMSKIACRHDSSFVKDEWHLMVRRLLPRAEQPDVLNGPLAVVIDDLLTRIRIAEGREKFPAKLKGVQPANQERLNIRDLEQQELGVRIALLTQTLKALGFNQYQIVCITQLEFMGRGGQHSDSVQPLVARALHNFAQVDARLNKDQRRALSRKISAFKVAPLDCLDFRLFVKKYGWLILAIEFHWLESDGLIPILLFGDIAELCRFRLKTADLDRILATSQVHSESHGTKSGRQSKELKRRAANSCWYDHIACQRGAGARQVKTADDAVPPQEKLPRLVAKYLDRTEMLLKVKSYSWQLLPIIARWFAACSGKNLSMAEILAQVRT
ncbi:MAG: hypothetical protein WC250_03090 [Candidatus Paceibacterota bacterium]|jgi:hypothetical protein